MLWKYAVPLKSVIPGCVERVLEAPSSDSRRESEPGTSGNARMRWVQDEIYWSGGLYTLLSMPSNGIPGCNTEDHRNTFLADLERLIMVAISRNPETLESLSPLQSQKPPQGFSKGLKTWPKEDSQTSAQKTLL